MGSTASVAATELVPVAKKYSVDSSCSSSSQTKSDDKPSSSSAAPSPVPKKIFSSDLAAKLRESLSRSQDHHSSDEYISIPRSDTDSIGDDNDTDKRLDLRLHNNNINGRPRRGPVRFAQDAKSYDGVNPKMFPYLQFVCDCFLNDPSFTAHYVRHHSVPLLTSTGLTPVRRKTVNASTQSREHDEEPNGNDKQRHRHSLGMLGKPSLFSSKMALRFFGHGDSQTSDSSNSSNSGSIGSFGSGISSMSTDRKIHDSSLGESGTENTGESECDFNEQTHLRQESAQDRNNDGGEHSGGEDEDNNENDDSNHDDERLSRRHKSKRRHKHKHKHRSSSRSKRHKHKSERHADSDLEAEKSQKVDTVSSRVSVSSSYDLSGTGSERETRRREQESIRKVRKSMHQSLADDDDEQEEDEEDDNEEEPPPRPPLTPQEAWENLPSPCTELPTLQLLHDLCKRYGVAMRRHDHQVCPILVRGGSSRAVYRVHVPTLRLIKHFVDGKFEEKRAAVVERSACRSICRAIYAHHVRKLEAQNQQRFKYVIKQNELVKIPI